MGKALARAMLMLILWAISARAEPVAPMPPGWTYRFDKLSAENGTLREDMERHVRLAFAVCITAACFTLGVLLVMAFA